MKKYRFYLANWASACTAKRYRAILKDWIAENGGVKTPLYVKDDVYVYATDKDTLHMVITSHDFDDLPSRLTNYGADILSVLMDAVEYRNDDDYDPEQALYEYLTD